MIYFDSRYSDGEIRKAFDSRNGKYRFTVYREWPVISTEFVFYEWVDGDRIDLVAERFYGNSQWWWRIMDANPDIVDPVTIPAGRVIRIPNG